MNNIKNDLTADLFLENCDSQCRKSNAQINKITKESSIAFGILALIAMAGIVAWGSISHQYESMACALMVTGAGFAGIVYIAFIVPALFRMWKDEKSNEEYYQKIEKEVPLEELEQK